MKVSAQITVDRPLDIVFAYYSDQGRLQEWIIGDGMLEFSPLTPAPKRPGSRYRMAYRSMGVTFRLIAELTKLEKNRRSEMRQVTGDYDSFHYKMLFAEDTRSTTSLIMSIEATLPWGMLGRIAEWLTHSQARREVNSVLQRFKLRAESLPYKPEEFDANLSTASGSFTEN
jgi:uncharacterized membrane protein